MVRTSASADYSASVSEDGGEGQSTPKLVAQTRAVLFVFWTFLMSLPLICVLIVVSPFVYLFDRKRRRLAHSINQL